MSKVKKFINEETSVAEAIVRVLEEAGIDMVFGIPGGAMRYSFFDALYDHKSSIRTVVVRHEALGGIMAEIYGRLTGKPGVVSGQGIWLLSNALLGTLEAYTGCSPMLLLGDLSDNSPFSLHAPYQSGTGEYGTWNAKQAFSSVTKLTMTPHEPSQAVQSTQLAIKHAMSGECGPVALLYHSTALKDKVNPDSLPLLYSTKHYLPGKPGVNMEQIASAAKALEQAERPVIIAGTGVFAGKAFDELRGFAECIGAPVTTTAGGKGVLPETHDLAIGVFGTFGMPVANEIVAAADVILCVGTKMSPIDTARENTKLIDPTRQIVIQIDVEQKNASWTIPCDHVVIGDAKEALPLLKSSLSNMGAEKLQMRKAAVSDMKAKHGYFDFSDSSSDAVPMLPPRIIAEVQKAVEDNAYIVCDAGENRIFMTHFFQTKGAGTFIAPSATGPVGYSIPAALAAKLVHPERQVVAVCGDGGFSMSMYGLITAVEEKIPIVVVVLNNSAFGWVRHGQGDRPVASELSDVDYAAIARAMGCESFHVESPAELTNALERAFAGKKPAVVDVVTSFDTSFKDVTSSLALS